MKPGPVPSGIDRRRAWRHRMEAAGRCNECGQRLSDRDYVHEHRACFDCRREKAAREQRRKARLRAIAQERLCV